MFQIEADGTAPQVNPFHSNQSYSSSESVMGAGVYIDGSTESSSDQDGVNRQMAVVNEIEYNTAVTPIGKN